MLQSMRSQRVGHNLVTEQQQQYCNKFNKDFLNDPQQKKILKTTTTTTPELPCKQVQISKDYPWRNSLSYHWREIMKGAGFHLAGTDVGDNPGSSNLLSVLECKLRLFIYICLHILEKAMAPHSSTLAWRIPWTEDPGGLQSTGSLRVGHDSATELN